MRLIPMIGKTLGHYCIVDKIGAGGMGLVYRAHDERLDRDVALKVLPAGALADDSARLRFRKEALALAKLAHPNIGMIFDFDTQDGVDFLAMEYVPGQSLAQKLRAGSLPEREILTLGAQVAAALEEAHDRGVVHRDLKPGNILITPKGQAKVLDFGLAKLLRLQGDAEATQTFTEAQDVAGTLPYMAPEQLRGEGADVRADIYALGCVLYELATGRRAFAQGTTPQLTDAILHQAPVGPRFVHSRISPQLEAILLKCLEKDPESRYQSAKELGIDLRRLASPSAMAAAAMMPKQARVASHKLFVGGAIGVVAILGLLVLLNVGGLRDRLFGRAVAPQIRSLAVLPLENLSRDPEQEYFADGMTEALITELAKVSALKVISRTSVMQYKGAKRPLSQIAKELNVDGVVEGSVERSGNRIRITVQLIYAPADQNLWAEAYQRDLREVLALQDEVARDVANEIKVKLTPQEQARLTRARPVNPEAHELYLRGRFHWNKRSPEGVRKSIEYFEQAIEKDPDNALAYSALADSYNVISSYNLLAPNEAFPKAKEAATKAVQLDDSLAEAHTSLAVVKAAYEWEWSGAEREYKRAIELNPGYATAHYWYAFSVLTRLGRFEEAIAEMNRALEFDPFSLIINTNLGWIFYYAHRYDDALEQCRKVLDLDSNFASAHVRMVQAYEQKGMFDDAIAETEKLIPLRREDQPEDIRALRKAYRTSGAKGYWRQRLGSIQQQMKHHYISPAFVASIYASLGEKDQAFLWLEHAYAERDNWLSFLKVDPRFDTLRSDPRFQDLLRRVGLPP